MMETAAAILTKLAYEQNEQMNARLRSAQGNEKELVALIMPLFNEMVSRLDQARQAYETFPSSIALPASS